jgi:hypothetical protein
MISTAHVTLRRVVEGLLNNVVKIGQDVAQEMTLF